MLQQIPELKDCEFKAIQSKSLNALTELIRIRLESLSSNTTFVIGIHITTLETQCYIIYGVTYFETYVYQSGKLNEEELQTILEGYALELA